MNNPLVVFWSYTSSKYEGYYNNSNLLSIVSTSGGIETINHAISRGGTILQYHEDSYLVYSYHYSVRTILYNNGTEFFAYNCSTGFQELFENSWDTIPTKIVNNRFLMFYSLGKWGMTDLCVENNLVITDINPPNSSMDFSFYSVDFLQQHSNSEIIFDVTIKRENSIELWEYNHLKEQWSIFKELKCSINQSHKNNPFDIELIKIDNSWTIFWDQKTEKYLTELFTVSYDVGTDKWSNIIKVTDTDQITDDYKDVNSFIISISTLSLLYYVLIRNKDK